MNEPKVDEAIEMLRWAEYNCDHVKKLGASFVDTVQKQIQEAIKLLGGSHEIE